MGHVKFPPFITFHRTQLLRHRLQMHRKIDITFFCSLYLTAPAPSKLLITSISVVRKNWITTGWCCFVLIIN